MRDAAGCSCATPWPTALRPVLPRKRMPQRGGRAVRRDHRPGPSSTLPVSTGAPTTVTLTMRTNINLGGGSDPDALDVLKGTLEVAVREGESAVVSQQVEDGGDEVTATFQFDPLREPTPIRIQVRAFREDGEPFDNEEASDRTVVFVDDGVTPQVAIVQPWPGQVFPVLPVNGVPLTLGSVNFTMRPPQATMQRLNEFGHSHVFQPNANAGATFRSSVPTASDRTPTKRSRLSSTARSSAGTFTPRCCPVRRRTSFPPPCRSTALPSRRRTTTPSRR